MSFFLHRLSHIFLCRFSYTQALSVSGISGGQFTAIATTGGIEKLVITSTGSSANVLTGVTNVSALKTITVDGSQKLTLGTVGAAVTSLNASTNSGGLVATLSSTTTTTVVGSSANDTLTAGTNLTTGTVDAGAGTDTLILTADAVIAVAADGAKFANFETLSVLNSAVATTARSQDLSLIAGITTVNATLKNTTTNSGADTTQSVAFTKASASTNTLNITALTSAEAGANIEVTDTVSFARATDTTADALTINLGTATAASGATTVAVGGAAGGIILNITASNEEAITINSLGGANFIGTIDDVVLKTLTLTGSQALSIASVGNASNTAMTSIDASAMTANLSIAANTGTIASTITGGTGNDSLIGGTKADSINGGAGNDQITGAAGVDILSGGEGNDTFVVATAADFQTLSAAETVDGGAGNDTLSFTVNMSLAASDIVAVKNVENVTFSSTGANSITLSDAFFTNGAVSTIVIQDTESTAALTVNATALTAANSVQITANGHTVSDSLVGGAGNDTFNFSTATVSANTGGTALAAGDTVTGGLGTDTLAISLVTTALTAPTLTNVSNIEVITVKDSGVNLAAGITLTDAQFVTTTTGTIQTTVGVVNASAMTGGGVFTFNGSSETDSTMSITGGIGDDVLVGGSKADTIIGGNGADQITGGAGIDNLQGGDGIDTFLVPTLTDFVTLSSPETVIGGAGSDILSFTENATTVVSSTDLTAISSVETINFAGTGTSAITLSDAMFTANGATTLAITDTQSTAALTVNAAALTAANSVQITANGHTVSDSLVGGAGNDTFSFSTATVSTNTGGTALATGDTVTGGAGIDTLAITIVTTALTQATLTNVSGIEKITFANTAGTLAGGVTLVDGNFVNVTGAVIDASGSTTTGVITIDASAELESTITITGGVGADVITGGAKNDSISGGVGADVITGGLGADVLTGGNDADTFVYALVTQSNSGSTDSITDFATGTDKLRVTLDYSAQIVGVDVLATIGSAKASPSLIQDSLSGQRGQSFYDTTGSALYINANADNLLTTSDYKININPASTAANSVVDGDINFVITGGAAGDTITAGGGADTITGGTGVDTIVTGAGLDVVIQKVGDSGAVTTSAQANPATVSVSGLDIITGSVNDIINLYTAAGGALTFTAYVEDSGQDSEAAVDASAGAATLGASGFVKTYTGTYSNGTFTTGAQNAVADMLVVYDTDGTGGGTTYQAIVLVGIDNVTVSTAGVITALAAV